MSRSPKLPIIDAEQRFLAQVSWAYHMEGLTQDQIAQKLSVTRLRVNKALAEARRVGLVRVTLDTTFAACPELEAQLCERFSLKQAYVAPSPERADDVQLMVGAALGQVLSSVLADKSVKRFGVSWGNTLNLATRFIASVSRPDMEIISVMGGATRGSDYNSLEITTRIADIMGARHSYFLAPLYVGAKNPRDSVHRLDFFSELLAKIKQVDALAIATSDLSRKSILIRDVLPKDVSIDDLRKAGGIGDLLGTIIDENGKPIDHFINERVLGMELEELRSIPNVILAAGGAHKVVPILAILRTGLVKTLVTDEATAKQVLLR